MTSPGPQRDPWLVAVLKQIPKAKRERVLYVFVGASLVIILLCLYLSPTYTALAGSAISVVRRFFGR
jgi:hypothetical protein